MQQSCARYCFELGVGERLVNGLIYAMIKQKEGI